VERRFVELIVRGPEQYARGWVRGFLAGRGTGAAVFFEGEAGFAPDSLFEEIKERLHVTHAATRTICDAETAELIRAGTEAAHEPGLTTASKREIESASFEYRFAIYNKEMGEAFAKALAAPPEGVALLDGKQSLRAPEEGGEPVPFGPSHRYEFHGEGRAEGVVDKIVRFRKELAGFDQAEVEPIRLKYRKA
jgi:hypothetical protein